MDDKLNPNNKKSEIDLSSFDLSQFKDYFEEEDRLKREEEERAEKIRIEKEKAKQAAAEKIANEKKLAEQKEREQKKAEALRIAQAQAREREKEETRRAAERAAAAAMAAKRAQEARKNATIQASAKLREQAEADNAIAPKVEINKADEQAEEKSTDFKKFASILDIEGISDPVADDADDDEISGFLVDESKTKGRIFSAICVALCVAIAACSSFSIYNFLNLSSNQASAADNTPSQGSIVDEFKPYSSLKINYKNADYPDSINKDLKPMYSQNDDLVGWITIPDTAVDMPVVQAKDNKHYLNYNNVFNESARYGTPFLDYRCNTFDLSKNTIVYGHYMNSKAHFGSLEGYTDVNYYKQHPIIKYDTLTKSYTFKIYAVFYATTQGVDDDGYVFKYYNPNMSIEKFSGYITMLKQYALYTSEAGLKTDDKIITLSTCSHVYDNLKSGGVDTRLVVVGRLLRSGESESVNTEKVLVNSDYRRPQIWYDSKGKTNPYASYRSWHPTK